MREILFRGKRLENGEWAEGNLFENDNDHFSMVMIGHVIMSRDKHTNALSFDGFDLCEVDPETVSQFTGQNANGAQLFDGDIFRYGDELMVVEWNTPDGRYACRSLDGTNWETPFEEIHWSCAEIIGNIHDNPELLEAPHAE